MRINSWCLLAILFVLVSCRNKEKKVELGRQNDSLVINSLEKKYDALSLDGSFAIWEPTTLYFQELIGRKKNFIITDCTFDDIQKLDSCYLLSINYGYSKYFELRTSEKVLRKLFPIFPESIIESYTINKFLIVKLIQVSKIKIAIKSDIEFPDDEKPTSRIEIGPATAHLFIGELIDVYDNGE